MARVYAFEVGSCRHPACMALKGAGLAAATFPSRAFLIETRSGELILFDTGYAERFFAAVSHGWGRLYGWMTPARLDPADSLTAQLARRGVRPDDIRVVVLSHFHGDHISGLLDFPGASVVCANAGWQSVRSLRGFEAVRQGFLRELVPLWIADMLVLAESLPRVTLPEELAPFGAGYQLVAGEVMLVPLPGHATGHMGAFVHTPHGWVLLAADAAWSDRSVAELRGPSELSFLLQPNREAYYATLRKVHALHVGGNARVVLTHAGGRDGREAPP